MSNKGWFANFAIKLVAIWWKKIARIGSVNPEIIGLQEIIKERKKEINASKTYGQPVKFAGWAKKSRTYGTTPVILMLFMYGKYELPLCSN